MSRAAPQPEPPRVIRVALADDSELVRIGLKTLLLGHPDIRLAGEAADARGAVALHQAARPDVLLLDIRLPDGDGICACRQIVAADPDACVLILTSVIDDRLVAEAIRAGARGYLRKEIDAAGLVRAIRDAAAGRPILDPDATARAMNLLRGGGALAALSPQECRVLEQVASGRTNKEAGSELGLSEKTVKNYLSRVFDKLSVGRRAEAAALFVRESGHAPPGARP